MTLIPRRPLAATAAVVALTIATAGFSAPARVQQQTVSQETCRQDFYRDTARLQKALGKQTTGWRAPCLTGPRGPLGGLHRRRVARGGARSRLVNRLSRCDATPEFGASDVDTERFALKEAQRTLLARLFGDADACLARRGPAARCLRMSVGCVDIGARSICLSGRG